MQFIIIGDGPEYNHLNAIIKARGLVGHIKMLGHCDNMSELYNVFDIFVLTSYSEGMSNSILEAMASEIPIIVSDIPPNKEIFESAQRSNLYIGEMFSTGNPNCLFVKIKKLLKRSNLMEIGRQARKTVLCDFSLNARIEQELSIYERCEA